MIMDGNFYIGTCAIDLTYKCTFRCLHCFNSSGEHSLNKQELSDAEILQFIDDINNDSVGLISIGGGEALLRKELILQISDYLSGNNSKIDLALVTNGYLMTKEYASQLRLPNIRSVQVSLDGFKENHERMRNMKGSYDRAIESIKYLIDAGHTVAVSFAPTKFNIDDIDELFEFVKKLGVKFFRCQPLMLLGRARKNLQSFIPTYEDYQKVSFILAKKRKENPKMYVEWGDPLEHIAKGRIKQPMLSYFSISAYGDILISPYIPITCGNIRKHSIREYIEGGLLDIWNNKYLQEVAARMNDTSEMDLQKFGLPEIFIDEAIDLDILSPDYRQKTEELCRSLAVTVR